MTLDQIIEQLDAAEKKATKAEWRYAGEALMSAILMDDDHSLRGVIGEPQFGKNMGWNFDFIVLARNHIRTLIEAVRDLRTLARAAIDWPDHDSSCPKDKSSYADCDCGLDEFLARNYADLSRIEAKHDS